ncbi:MAG: beta-propeller domain-containing protein [Methanomicrobiaceae archaeon]|nr:beta-propeller domain-containing protein [Methanomicrobiaceae archaeon]
MAKLNSSQILMVFLAAGVVAVACIFAYTLIPGLTGDKPSDDIIKVTSDAELKNFLEKYQISYEYSSVDYFIETVFGNGADKFSEEQVVYSSGAVRQSDSVPPSPVPASASDYSETNIQVKGVLEADFVKNDGKYIYIVRDDTLLIVDSYPPESASVVYEGKVNGQSCSSLFLNRDLLIVFTTDYKESWIKPEESSAPVPVTSQITLATVYDISDRKNPVIKRELELPGIYQDARMIDDYVYAVSRNSVSGYNEIIMPVVKEDNLIVAEPAIWCPPVYDYSYVMYTVTSFNVNNNKDTKSEAFLTGWDNTLYVSAENIYMAYERYLPQTRSPVSAGEINSVSSDDERQNTVIHRFSINKGDIKYRATGTVPGSLLNQWSLDEYDGYLRVATTVSGYTRTESYMYNNVYVLDSSLDITGRLEHIAPDERIYSARFMGDLLYLVTFKQIDPFFVIDLSNPKQPGILGELKIPGYSDYLHPYDENHIIGIGKSTEENQWGGVSAAGLKIALFDVADLNNPVLVDEVLIGESGTDSEILQDHKAFLFDYEKNIMVIPVYEVTKLPVENSRYENSYSRGTWNGAYVFGINPDSGFTLKGKVEQEKTEENYWNSYHSVKRSIFMDDYLYTISDNRIVMSDLKDLSTRLNSIDLPEIEYYYPYYKYGV